MKNKIVIFILIILVIAGLIFGAFKLFSSDTIIEASEKDIYVNILENEEKNNELKLNTDNTTIYYYFDLINYDVQAQKYNQTELTPYIKINFENKENLDGIIDWGVYKIDPENDLEENWKEINEKGDEKSSFAEYYKCENLLAFEEGNEKNNIQNYVVKINLNTETENFINLEEDLLEAFSIVLGYKEVK